MGVDDSAISALPPKATLGHPEASRRYGPEGDLMHGNMIDEAQKIRPPFSRQSLPKSDQVFLSGCDSSGVLPLPAPTK